LIDEKVLKATTTTTKICFYRNTNRNA